MSGTSSLCNGVIRSAFKLRLSLIWHSKVKAKSDWSIKNYMKADHNTIMLFESIRCCQNMNIVWLKMHNLCCLSLSMIVNPEEYLNEIYSLLLLVIEYSQVNSFLLIFFSFKCTLPTSNKIWFDLIWFRPSVLGVWPFSCYFRLSNISFSVNICSSYCCCWSESFWMLGRCQYESMKEFSDSIWDSSDKSVLSEYKFRKLIAMFSYTQKRFCNITVILVVV